MKKLFSICLLILSCYGISNAQTEFRHLSHDEAIAQAKAEGKLVFIDFYTQWCGPCKRMAREVFPLKEVGDYFNSKYVCISLDAENEAEGKPYLQKYFVAAFPTFVVVDPKNGDMLYNASSATFDGKEFCQRIENGINSDSSPSRIKARYESGERTPKVVSAIASQLINQAAAMDDGMGKMLEAVGIVDEYWQNLSDADKAAEENSFCYDSFYCSSFKDKKVQFACANASLFANNPQKGKIDRNINQIFTSYLQLGLIDQNPIVYDEVMSYKSDVANYNIALSDKDRSILSIYECSAKGEYKEVMKLVKSSVEAYGTKSQLYLLLGLDKLLPNAKKSLLKEAATYLREQKSQAERSADMIEKTAQAIEARAK